MGQVVLQNMHLLLLLLFIFLVSGKRCPVNWIKFREEKCIFQTAMQETFEEAQNHCESHLNADLLTVDSKDEEQFLAKENFFFFWIAVKVAVGDVNGSVSVVDTQWLYKQGNYTNWDLRQVDMEEMSDKQLCTEMHIGSNGLVWMPQDCDSSAFTICQRPLLKENTKAKSMHEKFLHLLQDHLAHYENKNYYASEEPSTTATVGDTTHVYTPTTEYFKNRADFETNSSLPYQPVLYQSWTRVILNHMTPKFFLLGALIVFISVLQVVMILLYKSLSTSKQPELPIVKAKSNDYMTLVRMESTEYPRGTHIVIKKI